MAVLNFPNSPTSGQIHTENSRSWIWDTVSWNPYTYQSVSVNKNIVTFGPLDNEPPVSGYANLGIRNGRPVLGFSDTTQEAAVFSRIIPHGLNLEGGLSVSLWAAAKNAVTGTIGWDVAFERVETGVTDTDIDSFGTPKTITPLSVPATSGILTNFNTTFTQGQLPSGLAAGDLFRLRVRRDVANDTAVDNAELFFVEIKTPV